MQSTGNLKEKEKGTKRLLTRDVPKEEPIDVKPPLEVKRRVTRLAGQVGVSEYEVRRQIIRRERRGILKPEEQSKRY